MRDGSFKASILEGMALGIGAFLGLTVTTLVVGGVKKLAPGLPIPDPSTSVTGNPKLP